MTKLRKMHCVIGILTIGEQVRTRRNLAYLDSWGTVVFILHSVGTTCAPTASTEEFLPGFACMLHDSTSKYATGVWQF